MLTDSQRAAIGARGNVLVMAGAGTGKTRTLVERCIHLLLHEQPALSLDEILMVTFTEAAAAEMRQRIRTRLEEEAANAPSSARWQEQLALFDLAHIGTLHSFCLRLVREHFYLLELDPQLAIMPEEEAYLLAQEVLDDLLERLYAGDTPLARDARALIHTHGRGNDKAVRELLLRIYRYAQSLPQPERWFDIQLAAFSSAQPGQWEEWLATAVAECKARWFQRLKACSSHNEVAVVCCEAWAKVGQKWSREKAAKAIEEISAAFRNCRRGKKKHWVDPFKRFQAETEFLACLLPENGTSDPLLEDWQWVRAPMATLLQCVREFTGRFSEAKRELGVADFQDLEQHALRLLWQTEADQPSAVAQTWREKLRFIFVDEYQDINAAQDKIIEALSRPDGQSNRFLVGDVKQSIYRFRLAAPHIFQGYAQTWRTRPGTVIYLSENFRSRGDILRFVNALFGRVMKPELGGIEYDQDAHLLPGSTERTPETEADQRTRPAVEVHIRLKDPANGSGAEKEADEENGTDSAAPGITELLDAEKEARLVGARLKELHAGKTAIWDDSIKALRPVNWGDMVVLLRSPTGKSESYAKEFSRLGIPLVVERGGFYSSQEVLDLLSILQLLDNPLQDVPLLAVLRSPVVGLTVDELAEIRVARRGRFWIALNAWHEQQLRARKGTTAPPRADCSLTALDRVNGFLESFHRWRRLAREASLCRCLEYILAETHYDAWVLTQARAEQRHANVRKFVDLARQFDRLQRQGLFRFLRFAEAQQNAAAEPPVVAARTENAVRLMSIHQSKGLEFPVVAVADLGKPFNAGDLNSDIILDEVYGLSPRVKLPQGGRSYPSLAHWLARRRQFRELLAEELRLLYVAFTRARDVLLLSGSLGRNRFEELTSTGFNQETTSDDENVRCYSDWVCQWLAANVASDLLNKSHTGSMPFLRWRVYSQEDLATLSVSGSGPQPVRTSLSEAEIAEWHKIQEKLARPYPYGAATRTPAKTSVTMLRVRAELNDDEVADFATRARRPESIHSTQARARFGTTAESRRNGGAVLSRAEEGIAHHQFLQRISLREASTQQDLARQAKQLVARGALLPEQADVLDLEGLAAFWRSDVGRQIVLHQESVRRELAFTLTLSAAELGRLAGESPEPSLENESVVVQGVVDLAVILPKEIWLVDFKTDALTADTLGERTRTYEPQLRAYAVALEQIYRIPVRRCWLHFLAIRKSVPVELEPNGEGSRSALANFDSKGQGSLGL